MITAIYRQEIPQGIGESHGKDLCLLFAQNIDFCKRLTDELQKRDLDFWVDWKGIPPTVDWMKEIAKGIEEADTFLFIISPDSITSKVCKDELGLAVKNGKRLIPVATYEIKWDDVPAVNVVTA